MPLNGRSVRFGDFELDRASAELTSHGSKVQLQEQPFQVLLALLESPGEVVSRDELRVRLWPDNIHVDYERSLNAAITRLRHSLGDEVDQPRYIETLPRHGYRLIASVTEAPAAEAPTRAPRTARNAWIAVAVLVLLAISIGLFKGPELWNWIFHRQIRSLAVLPLKNLNGDPKQEYFADGMTEALIAELSRLEPLRVISFSSAMRLKRNTKPLPQLAKELGVDGFVEGSVLREGDRIRIRTRLVNAWLDRPVWSDTYDRDMSDLLSLQAEVAHAIASEIQIKLSTQQRKRIDVFRGVDPEVQQSYLEGRYYANRAEMEQSTKAFERAIAKDPNFAPAYAGVAMGLIMRMPTIDFVPRAREMALRALALDDSLAEAHMALGTIYMVFDWNWAGAEKEFTRALQLDPSSPVAHDQYAYLLVATGRPQEALAEAWQALRLDPLSIAVSNNYGRMLYFNRQYDKAIEQFTQSLELDPRSPMSYMLRGFARQTIGQYAAAFADFRKGWTFTNNVRGVAIADEYNRTKDRDRAIRSMAELFEAGIPSGKAQPSSVAMAYLQIGEINKVFEFLEVGYRMRSRSMFYTNAIPEYDSIRNDPRFKDLLRRMNLAK